MQCPGQGSGWGDSLWSKDRGQEDHRLSLCSSQMEAATSWGNTRKIYNKEIVLVDHPPNVSRVGLHMRTVLGSTAGHPECHA